MTHRQDEPRLHPSPSRGCLTLAQRLQRSVVSAMTATDYDSYRTPEEAIAALEDLCAAGGVQGRQAGSTTVPVSRART